MWELAEHCEAPHALGWTAGHVAPDLADSMIAELNSSGHVRWQRAKGWVAGRFAAAGWPWATSHLETAGTWPASRAAGFLLALPPDGRAFDWADQLGAEVRERYWENVQPLSIRDNADRERASRTLAELGRAASALGALAMIVHRGSPADPGPGQDIEQGIDMAIFNARGVTWRGMDTGGQPERALADKHQDFSTLLSCREGGGEPVGGDGLAAQGAGAEDEGEHDLQFAQDLVQAHPGAGTFGSALIMVMKAWARTARVTWRCQPVNERPSKWSRPRPVFSSR